MKGGNRETKGKKLHLSKRSKKAQTVGACFGKDLKAGNKNSEKLMMCIFYKRRSKRKKSKFVWKKKDLQYNRWIDKVLQKYKIN